MSRRRPGFTLFELLTVMVIISIVAAVVVGSVNRITLSTRRGETMGRLRVIAAALSQYRQDWGDVPPYNPRGDDLDQDGNADPNGLGLYALVMLDYLRNYRMLNDPQSAVPVPWVDNGGSLMSVTPGDDVSMGAVYAAFVAGGWTVGDPLGPAEEYATFAVMADAPFHGLPTPLPTDYGQYAEYNPLDWENYCSWQMADAYTGEWKYLPVRQGQPSPSGAAPAGTTFPVDDPLGWPDLYHRQLSHRWSDEDSPSYLPAADTVVTWASLYRTSDRRPAFGMRDWGQDIVVFADGQISILPGPADSATATWTEGRAVQRPQP